jgi:hypothetical protein
MKTIFQIDPDHAGLNDLGHMCPDFGRRRAIPTLDICCHRHLRATHNARGHSHHLRPGSLFAIGIA